MDDGPSGGRDLSVVGDERERFGDRLGDGEAVERVGVREGQALAAAACSAEMGRRR